MIMIPMRCLICLALVLSLLCTMPGCMPQTPEGKGKPNVVMPEDNTPTYMPEEDFETLVQSFENSERDVWQKPDEVVALMGDLKGKTVADIGAGTGYFSFRLATRAGKTISIDIDERFLAYIANKNKTRHNGSLNMEVRQSQTNSPGLAPQEVDVVIVVNTYHHIDARTEYFRQVYNGLKPGGKLFVVDFKKGDFPMGPPDRLKLDIPQIRKELEGAGFTPVQQASLRLPYQFVLVAQKP
jgi:ubiquinone/menaquinone biosynthesis C-methylase UbiE